MLEIPATVAFLVLHLCALFALLFWIAALASISAHENQRKLLQIKLELLKTRCHLLETIIEKHKANEKLDTL